MQTSAPTTTRPASATTGQRWLPLLLTYVLLVLAAIALSLAAWAWTGGGVELTGLALG